MLKINTINFRKRLRQDLNKLNSHKDQLNYLKNLLRKINKLEKIFIHDSQQLHHIKNIKTILNFKVDFIKKYHNSQVFSN